MIIKIKNSVDCPFRDPQAQSYKAYCMLARYFPPDALFTLCEKSDTALPMYCPLRKEHIIFKD